MAGRSLRLSRSNAWRWQSSAGRQVRPASNLTTPAASNSMDEVVTTHIQHCHDAGDYLMAGLIV